MATIGQPLTTPETGWSRYDSNLPQFSYNGTWAPVSNTLYNNGTAVYCSSLGSFNFKFVGTKLRLLGYTGTEVSLAQNIKVTIDGVSQTIPSISYAYGGYQGLWFEVNNLTNTTHSVTVEKTDSSNALYFDTVDIDSTGYLVTQVGQALLRITMNDSSEREYQLTSTELGDFISWFNKHTSTDDTSFMFNKTVGAQSSKEYLAFDKIISFEVIPVA